ncbi:phosphotransferase enzyme family protein [Microlunatus parietis]|uniref:Ser/Thr protein kinase RdoA (MazF antagonist) n=1 Tax=Microlunatus parietis TaxID=682979 RepID=A0A7Y9LFF2_9ACTN|nr:phosphotransferase [Microlunatus parietis]NYE74788.1 Ser/Thr protein kinase RdoA (MazF antagonist) [Microlunatus parietis]
METIFLAGRAGVREYSPVVISPPDDDALLELVHRHWPVGEVRLRPPPRGTHNLTRIVVADRPIAVLRLYQTLDHDRVLAEHRLLARLAAAGLPFRVPTPRPTRDGATVIESRWGAVSLIDWIEGQRPDLGRDDTARAAGRALGRLDAALAGVPAKDAPFDWLSTDVGRAGLDHAMITALAAAGLPGDQVDWLHDHSGSPLGTANLPVQIIHCDVGAYNLLAIDDPAIRITGVIDFEFAGRDLRVFDLTILLYQSGYLHDPDWRTRTTALVGGYAEAVRLDPAEIMIIPELIMARALGAVGWRAGLWRRGAVSVEDVAARIPDAVRTERWIGRHRAELIDILGRAMVAPPGSSP